MFEVFDHLSINKTLIKSFNQIHLSFINNNIYVYDKHLKIKCITQNCISYQTLFFIIDESGPIFILKDVCYFLRINEYIKFHKNNTLLTIPVNCFIGYLNTKTNTLFHTSDLNLDTLNKFLCFITTPNNKEMFLQWLCSEKTLAYEINVRHAGHLIRDYLALICEYILLYNIKTVVFNLKCEIFFHHTIFRDILKQLDVNLLAYKKKEYTPNFILLEHFKRGFFLLPYTFYKTLRNASDTLLFKQLQKQYLHVSCTKYSNDKSVLIVLKHNYRCTDNQLEVVNSIIVRLKPFIKNFIIQEHIQVLNSNPYIPDTLTTSTVQHLRSTHSDLNIFDYSEIHITNYIQALKNVVLYIAPLGTMQHIVDAYTPTGCIGICLGFSNTPLHCYPNVHRISQDCITVTSERDNNLLNKDQKFLLDSKRVADFIHDVFCESIKSS